MNWFTKVFASISCFSQAKESTRRESVTHSRTRLSMETLGDRSLPSVSPLAVTADTAPSSPIAAGSEVHVAILFPILPRPNATPVAAGGEVHTAILFPVFAQAR